MFCKHNRAFKLDQIFLYILFILQSKDVICSEGPTVSSHDLNWINTIK